MLEGQTDFESALRQNEVLLEETSVPIQGAAESQAVAIPTTPPDEAPEVPALDPDRELIWRVDGCSVRFHLVELLAKPAVTSGTALDSSNAIVLWVGNTLCLLARTADSEFMFSADAAGNYSVEITVSSIDLEPWARRSNDTEKIPAAKLPPLGLSQSQVDARVRALENRGDQIKTGSFTGVGGPTPGKFGGVGIMFTPAATELTIDTVFQSRDDNGINVRVTPLGHIADLRGLKLSINDHLLSFDDAADLEDEDDVPAYTQAIWLNQPAGIVKVGQNTVTVYEPLGPENFVPEGKPADDGKVLKRATAGPVWGNAIAPTEVGSPYPYTLDDANWADTGLSIPRGKQWLLLSLKNFQERSRGAATGEITALSNEVFVRITDLLSPHYSANRNSFSDNTYNGVSINFAGPSDNDAGDLHFAATSTGNLLIASHHRVQQQGTLRVRAL